MKSNIQQKFYDEMYANGRKHKVSFFAKFEKHREEAVFELLPSGEKLLELACGAGNLAIRTAEKFDEVVGLDVSRNLIERARRKVDRNKTKNVKFLVANADEGLPFIDKSFNAVTAVAALAHFYDPIFVVSEVARVLRKGGIFIPQVPNVAYLPRRLALLFGKLPRVSTSDFGWDGGHLHYFTEAEVLRLLNKNGFETTEVSCSGVLAKTRSMYPSLLGGDLIFVCIKK